MNWKEFKDAAPELASVAEKLFDASGMVLVGTIRKDGSPRISPVEPLITSDQLYLGMMWQSRKAHDLLRDPRCTVHNSISDRMAPDGEIKLYGRASDVQDLDERRRYGAALQQKIGWSPEGMNYHLFAVDVASAAFFITEGEARIMKRWKVGGPVEVFRQSIDGTLIPST